MNLNYNEIVDRIQTFHEVLKVTERRDKVYTSDERNELKDSIMKMDQESYTKYKQEHEQTKQMGSIEYQAYIKSKLPPVEEKVFYHVVINIKIQNLFLQVGDKNFIAFLFSFFFACFILVFSLYFSKTFYRKTNGLR